MKFNFIKSIFFLTVCSTGIIFQPCWAKDEKLEDLKAKANTQTAQLNIEKTTEFSNKAEMDYLKYDFLIDTATVNYKMIYRTFIGEEAIKNPELLSDWSSGYGMVEPDRNWYDQGFIEAYVPGIAHSNIKNCAGKVRTLQTEGERVGYDLIFEMEGTTIVVRTVALAGRDELFVSVKASYSIDGLFTRFLGYPMGFTEPFDRWVHTATTDIPNAGEENKDVLLDVATDHWALLTDHLFTEGAPGQLGIFWIGDIIDQIKVTHSGNYGIKLSFLSKEDDLEQRFMICRFDTMTWQEAREKMVSLSTMAPDLIEKALGGWGEVQSPQE